MQERPFNLWASSTLSGTLQGSRVLENVTRFQRISSCQGPHCRPSLVFQLVSNIFTPVKSSIDQYSVIFCCTLKIIQSQILVTNPFVSTLLTSIGSSALLSVLGSHLLINLKEAGELGVNGGTNYRSRTVSDIDFTDSMSSLAFLPSTKLIHSRCSGSSLE